MTAVVSVTALSWAEFTTQNASHCSFDTHIAIESFGRLQGNIKKAKKANNLKVSHF